MALEFAAQGMEPVTGQIEVRRMARQIEVVKHILDASDLIGTPLGLSVSNRRFSPW